MRPERIGICWGDWDEEFWWDATDDAICPSPSCSLNDKDYGENHTFYVPESVIKRYSDALYRLGYVPAEVVKGANE